MTGAQSRKVHTEPEWAWSLTDQAHALGIPVFMKEDFVSVIGDESAETSKLARNLQAASSRGGKSHQTAGDEHQGAADASGSMEGNEAGVGARKKPTPRRRGEGVLRATEAEARTETSRALIGAGPGPRMNRVRPLFTDLLMQVRGSGTLDISLFPLCHADLLLCYFGQFQVGCRF